MLPGQGVQDGDSGGYMSAYNRIRVILTRPSDSWLAILEVRIWWNKGFKFLRASDLKLEFYT